MQPGPQAPLNSNGLHENDFRMNIDEPRIQNESTMMMMEMAKYAKNPHELALMQTLQLLQDRSQERKLRLTQFKTIPSQNQMTTSNASSATNSRSIASTCLSSAKEMEYQARKERLKKYADKLEVHKEKRGMELDTIFQNLLVEASQKLNPSSSIPDELQKESNGEKEGCVENDTGTTIDLSSLNELEASKIPQQLLDMEIMQQHFEQGLEQLIMTILYSARGLEKDSNNIEKVLNTLLDFNISENETADSEATNEYPNANITSSRKKELKSQHRVGHVIESQLSDYISEHDDEEEDSSYNDKGDHIREEKDYGDYREKEKHPRTILKEHQQHLEQNQHQSNNHYLRYSENEGMLGIEAIHEDEDKKLAEEKDGYMDQLEGDKESVYPKRHDVEKQLDDSTPTKIYNNIPDTDNATSLSLHTSNNVKPTALRRASSHNVSADNESSIHKLYSHLLPYGMLLSSHPHLEANKTQVQWIDTPEEEDKGYTTHPITKSRLIELESDFQNMVHAQLEDTEGDLLQEEDRNSPSKEEQFEQDLKVAEDLLENEERRAKAVAEGVALGGKIEDMGGGSASEPNVPHSLGILSRIMGKSDTSEQVEDDDQSGHSNDSNLVTEDSDGVHTPIQGNNHVTFQHVKKIGRGKEGDLEKFSLPVVFNSFQTGFEPTKNLGLEPGTIVAGQYLVESELGSAAFSTAYRCVDMTADPDDYYCEVCLKVIKNTKDFFDQSLDEIKVLELLRQTGECEENNILEMRSFFYYKEHLIIVTELLRQNLFEFGKFITDNDEVPYFTMTRLCYITRQTLIALNFIHNLGLIHSDIKPENILIASYSRARVKLIDFGSSCFFTDRQSSYIQSRSYRAPEVILGLPYDGKIDMWSLGCVVAEMFTGQVTFQNRSVVSMLSRIEAICGPFPKHIYMNGKQSSNYFTPNGLIYERIGKNKANDEEDDELSDDYDEEETNASIQEEIERSGEDWFKIYTPKMTTLAERLGFDADLMERPRDNLEDEEKALFTDFVRSMLAIDPESRPTAAEALRHPWIVSGENLTESDVRYSPEGS